VADREVAIPRGGGFELHFFGEKLPKG